MMHRGSVSLLASRVSNRKIVSYALMLLTISNGKCRSQSSYDDTIPRSQGCRLVLASVCSTSYHTPWLLWSAAIEASFLVPRNKHRAICCFSEYLHELFHRSQSLVRSIEQTLTRTDIIIHQWSAQSNAPSLSDTGARGRSVKEYLRADHPVVLIW